MALAILTAHTLVGMNGVALAALGMPSSTTRGLTTDAFGPFSDDAGGRVAMCGLSKDVRKITDALDAAGHTTAAIGKGFAIGFGPYKFASPPLRCSPPAPVTRPG